MKQWIDQLFETGILSGEQLLQLLEHVDEENSSYLFEKARIRQKEHFDHKVYTRGLIELTNYCKNDCYYCGIRRSNRNIDRYRLTKEQVLSCCKVGYPLGFRTFVLQGGEDGQFTDAFLVDLIQSIKQQYPDCAITLSLGERVMSLIPVCIKREPTVICCAMKQQTQNITVHCIQRICPWNTVSIV